MKLNIDKEFKEWEKITIKNCINYQEELMVAKELGVEHCAAVEEAKEDLKALKYAESVFQEMKIVKYIRK